MATGTFDILHPGHTFYLNEAKKLAGPDATLIVVIATDKTVEKNKHVPIIPQEQRCELISQIKCVDQAFIGSETDPFEIVKDQKPDIIAIGPDQDFVPEKLHDSLKKIGLDIKVVKIRDYKKFELDSSCKIIRKIKRTHFTVDAFKDCEE